MARHIQGMYLSAAMCCKSTVRKVRLFMLCCVYVAGKKVLHKISKKYGKKIHLGVCVLELE